jgi:hypothetical protein
VRRAGRQLHDGDAVLLGSSTKSEIKDRKLLVEIARQQDHALGRAGLVDSGSLEPEHQLCGKSVADLGVDRIRSDHTLCELRPRVGVLVGEPCATDHADRLRAVSGFDLGQPIACEPQGP